MITNVNKTIHDDGSSQEWRDDTEAETILNFIGIPFSVRDVNFADIDDHESANNCARMSNPLSAEKIEEYEASMRRCDIFPRVVVEKGKRGWVILGGNQRVAASKRAGSSYASAYVVDTLTESHRQCVIRSLNSRHGWGTDKAERIEHAVYLVRSNGISTDDAAKLMCVGVTTINARIKAEDTRRELSLKGVDANRICNASLTALARITDADAQVKVANMAVNGHATAESVSSVASKIEAAKGKGKKLEIVKNWQATVAYIAPRSGTKTMATPVKQKFTRKMNDIIDFLERGRDGGGFDSLDSLQCNEARDGDAIRLMAAKLIHRLQLITRG